MKNKYINLIISKLKKLNPEKVILFGSQAEGTAVDESDIDLIVVTNDEFYPKNYRERMDVQLRVSKALTDVTQKIPVDLIVYTKPMYKKFLELDSLFSREITQKGKVLYETCH